MEAMIQSQSCTAERSFPAEIDTQPQIVTSLQREQIGHAFSHHDSLNVLMEIALVLSRATGVAIALSECGEMVCRAATGTLASDVGMHIDARGGLLGLCLRTGGVLSSEDLNIDERVDRAAAGDLGARSAIVLPLCNDGKVLGVLEAVSSELSAFDDRSVGNLRGLADVVAQAILSNSRPESPSIAEITPRPVGGVVSTAELPPSSSVQGRPLPALVNAETRTRVTRLSITKLVLATTLSLLAVASGVVLVHWEKSERREPWAPSKATSLQAAEPKPAENRKSTFSDSANSDPSFQSSNSSEVAQVTGTRFLSSESFTEVAVGLSVAVHYDAHRFHNPERIFFDLHSASLAPALGPWGKTLNVGDKFLVRVRVAQHALGLTRVVLDTKEALVWSTTLAGSPPQLVITVSGRNQDPKRKLPAVRLPQISLNAADRGGAIHDASLRGDTTTTRGMVPSHELVPWVRKSSSVPRGPALRAIYLTGPTVGSLRGLQLIDDWGRMGGNAIVFDIKDNTGIVNVPFEHPLNDYSTPPINNLRNFVAYLHSCGMYAIGRISVFQDERLVTQHPELAIRSRRSGKPWKEKDKIAWVDPSKPEVQQYNIALARAAAAAGLDEVQLDYIRFPVQGDQKDAKFQIDAKHVRWRRSDVITHLVAEVYSQLHPRGVRLSLDVFGVLAWDHPADLASTGQDIRAMMHHCDVISPMIYPSHFFHMDGYTHPGDAPRHFIAEAMKRFRVITAGTRVLVRPWLQGFAWHTTTYSTEYVLKQIDAAQENGGTGFLFWNAENEYREPLAALSAMRSADQSHKSSSR